MERTPLKLAAGGTLTRAGRLLVIALTVWALAVVTPDLYRVVVPYPTLGFTADNDGEIAVTGPPAGTARLAGGEPLRDGDHVALRAMRCFAGTGISEGCRNLLAVFGGMGGLQYVRPGQHVVLDVVADGSGHAHPSDRPQRIELTASASGDATPWSRVILALDELAGIFFILLAARLVWRTPNGMTWGFFLYAMWFNPGQYFVAYAALQLSPAAMLAEETLQAVAQGIGYAGFVFFALRFPNDTTERRWTRWEWGAVCAGGVLIVLQLLSFTTALGYPTEAVTRMSYIAGYAVDVFVVIALYRRSRTQTPVDRQRTRWVVYGAVIGLSAFIFADSNEATTMWAGLWDRVHYQPSESVIDVFYLVNFSLAYAVFHAVRRDRVSDVRFALSRGLVLVALSVLFLAVFTGIHAVIEKRLEEETHLAGTITFVVAAVLTLLFDVMREKANEVCDRLFFRRLHTAEERFTILGRELARTGSFDGLERLLIDEIAAALELASVTVFRSKESDGRGPFVRHVAAPGWGAEMSTQLDPESGVVELARSAAAPVRVEPAAWERMTVPRAAGRPILALPIMQAGTLFAIVLCGAHTTGDSLNPDERATLRPLADAAALAYVTVGASSLRNQIRELRRELAAALRGTSPGTNPA